MAIFLIESFNVLLNRLLFFKIKRFYRKRGIYLAFNRQNLMLCVQKNFIEFFLKFIFPTVNVGPIKGTSTIHKESLFTQSYSDIEFQIVRSILFLGYLRKSRTS